MSENKTLQLMFPDGMKIKLHPESFKICEGKSLIINGKKIPFGYFIRFPWENGR